MKINDEFGIQVEGNEGHREADLYP